MLSISLFGAGRACYDERLLPGFPCQQHGLLLCYLALNRRHSYSREQLASIFWADYPTSTARKYLRNTLWRLRCCLESAGAPVSRYLLVQDDAIGFAGLESCWLDVEAFEASLGPLRHCAGQKLTPGQAEQLDHAVQLYQGDLLDTLYEDWCLYERERLHLLYLETLTKLMDYCRASGEYERGLAYGERILDCDNTRERVHRKMMDLYSLLGNQSAAIAQYKRCTQILREALNLSPMAETQQLYEQIVGSRSPALSQTLPAPLSLLQNHSPASIKQLVQHLIRRLQRLESRVEETNAELHQVSTLLSAILDDSLKDATVPSQRRSIDAP